MTDDDSSLELFKPTAALVIVLFFKLIYEAISGPLVYGNANHRHHYPNPKSATTPKMQPTTMPYDGPNRYEILHLI